MSKALDKAMDALNSRQRLFVRELAADPEGNQTRAAIRAGYSKRTADSQASRMLRTVKVKKALKALSEHREKKLDISAERVDAELARIGFFDMGKYLVFGEAGVKLDLKAMQKAGDTAVLSELIQEPAALGQLNELVEDGQLDVTQLLKTRCKTNSKLKALEMLCHRHGYIVERHEIRSELTQEQVLVQMITEDRQLTQAARPALDEIMNKRMALLEQQRAKNNGNGNGKSHG
jgi:hypothetical protein